MSSSRDYYEVLGIARDADGADIKRAFRKLARELHPDVNPDDPKAEERFREVTAAYEVLSNDERRSVYDRYGEAGLKQRHWEPTFAFGDLADIFSAFFGEDVFGGPRGGRASAVQSRGENVAVSVSLTLAEAAVGAQRDVTYDVTGRCQACDGRGAASEADIERCGTCGGHGVVRHVTRSLFGQVIQEGTCPKCGGRGAAITKPCRECSGTGEQVDERTVTVDVPAGISDGQRIRLSGHGHSGSGNVVAGNLYIHVEVTPDERFLREGDDLVTVVDVTAPEASLGCIRDVDMVDGDTEAVAIRAGTQPGEIIVLQGRGMGHLRSGEGRGDLRIVVNVLIPTHLTDEQRAHLESFRDLETDRTYATDEGLLGKLRRVLRP